jgi:DNA-binding beta-propeller fold protein YncE
MPKLSRLLLITFFGCLAAAQSPQRTGVIVVANSADSTASIIAAYSLRVLATLPTGPSPHEVTISSDGKTAFVANTGSTLPGGKSVTVINLSTLKVARTIDLPECSPHDLTVNRNTTLLWATCIPLRRGILEVNLKTNATLFYPTGEDGGWMLEVSPDDKHIYVGNLEGGSVSIIERATNTARTVRLAAGQMIVEPSADGKEVWTSNFNNGEVTILDPASARVVGTVTQKIPGAARLRFLPDQRTLLVVANKSISVVDRKSRQLNRTIPLEQDGKCIALSRDGRFAWVTNPDHNSITLVDLKAERVLNTIPVGNKPDGIAWSAIKPKN